MDLTKIKIKVQIVNKGKVIGIASIEVGDMEHNGFRIVGFKILSGMYDETGHYDKNGNPIWVAAPSYTDNVGAFKNIFYAAPELWKELQNKIIEEYLTVFNGINGGNISA